ncbi:ABC transporter permease [Shumkonia mesophila]|uniref:ABC transporter permease n=1 Tax=Shumkonia mesophila TaxID=2838854 RepID=UPI002934EDA7|nr:ABC transporter permease [Shumkonia mesophila]
MINSRFIVVKTLRAIITLWIVVTFVFFVLRLSGDPVLAFVGADAPPDVLLYYTKLYGFDQPLHVQYFRYVVNLFHGDFGISVAEGRDAAELVAEAVPRTVLLGGISLLISLVAGLPLGMIAALHRNKAIDRLVMSFAVFGFSIPNFFLGILLILIFSLWLRLLPSSGMGTVWHLIMPAITLSTSTVGQIARFARSSMLEVLSKPYMRTAKAKGVHRERRLRWHALPNAGIPIITIIGFRLGDLVVKSIITETVFAWPGAGRMLVVSVASRDLAVVQALLLLTAATMVVANLLVDLAYGWIDPRIRTGADGGES